MSLTDESNEEIQNEILKFIDSININEIEEENIDRIISATERLFNSNNLRKCKELIIRKFIKLSIHLIKYFHKSLQNLPNFATLDTIMIGINLGNLYTPILSIR
jgi:hypothetical protein